MNVLDSLQRRYRRREGVTEEDIKEVEKILRDFRDPPSLADEEE